MQKPSQLLHVLWNFRSPFCATLLTSSPPSICGHAAVSDPHGTCAKAGKAKEVLFSWWVTKNWEEAEGLGLAQLGKEMAVGGPNGHLPVPSGQWSRRWSHNLALVYGRMRHNGWKLKKERFRLDIRSNFFPMRAGRHWRRSSRKAVKSVAGGFH